MEQLHSFQVFPLGRPSQPPVPPATPAASHRREEPEGVVSDLRWTHADELFLRQVTISVIIKDLNGSGVENAAFYTLVDQRVRAQRPDWPHSYAEGEARGRMFIESVREYNATYMGWKPGTSQAPVSESARLPKEHSAGDVTTLVVTISI